MKTSNVGYWVGLGLLIFFLTSCGASPALSLTPTTAPVANTVTSTAAPTGTRITSPSATPTPTKAVSTPGETPTTANISLLPVVETRTAHPLALNEFNAGTEMKRINIYGTGTLQDMTFSPDGKYLAAATGRGIYLYDGKTFEQVGFIDVNDKVAAIAFSPDGLVVVAAINGEVSLWNTLSGQKMSTLDGKLVYIWTLAYGKGGYVAAVGSTCANCGSPQQGMILWNAQTGKQIYFEKDIWHATESLAFASDGKRLAFGGSAGMTIIETETGKYVDSYTSGGGVISEAVDAPLNFIFSSDDNLLFVKSNEVKDSQILDIASKQRRVFSLCNSRFIRANSVGACFSKDKIILFDLLNGQKISEIDARGINYDDNLVAFSPDGKNIAYRVNDTVHAINTQTGSEIKTLIFNAFDNVQTEIIFLNGEQKYAAALQNKRGQVDLIDVETGALLQTYALPNGYINGFAFRPDGRTVATLDGENRLALWDIQSQQIIYHVPFPKSVQSPFAFSPNGQNIFFTAPDRNIFSFDLVTQTTLSIKGKNAYSYGYADVFVQNNYHFNEVGNLVLFGIFNNAPEFWDVKTDQKITLPFEVVSEKQYMEIEAFALNTTGKFLAFGSTTGIYAWNLETMEQIATLSGHEGLGGDGWYGRIRGVFFSPQSNLLASVGWDQTTRLWNINGGQEIRRLNVCCSATFTADGRFLLIAGDGVLRVWGIPNRP